MELPQRTPSIQPAGWILRLILIVQMIGSPLTVAHANTNGVGQVQTLYAAYSAQPFDEAKAREFLTAVGRNQTQLAATPEGKALIAKASRARMVLAMKRQLDKCFGGDILQLESARLALNAAMNSDYEPDCAFSNSALENLDGFSGDLEAWIAKDNSGDQAGRRSDLVKALFTDTALRAADAETRLRFLFQDTTGEPELLSSMCGADLKGCPAEFVSAYKQRAQAEKQRLQAAGYRPLPSTEIAKRLNSSLSAMYDTVYHPSRSYHAANFDPDRWSALEPGKNDPPEYTRPAGEARLTFQPYPNAFTHPGLSPSAYKEMATELEARYQAAVPEDFYRQQEKLRADQYGVALATSPEWMHALGHGATIKPVPFVMGQPGVMMGLVATDRSGNQTAIGVDRTLSLITGESVRKNREDSLNRLNETIGEMGARVFSTSTRDDQRQEDLQKLLIANPRAAGELLLRNPKNADLFCEGFLGIQRDENIDKYITWGLLGLTIGAAIVTGGASLLGAGAVATMGSATLAAVGAVDIVYGVSEGLELTELGQMQHATCVTDGPDSPACEDYQSTLNSALTNFALAGIGAAGSGPFLRTLGRLSRGSTKLLLSAADEAGDAARFLRSVDGRKLASALDDAQNGELLAHLAQLDDAARAKLAAHLRGMTDSEAAAFSRKLLEDLRSGKSIRDLSAGWGSAVKGASTRIKAPGTQSATVRGLDPGVFPPAPGPKWTSAMYDPATIARDADGRVIVPADYSQRLREMAIRAEEAGYDVVIRKPGKNHHYDLLCIERGPSNTVLGRVAGSRGMGRVPICVDPFSKNLGSNFKDEDLITLNLQSLGDAIKGRGYVLLHEAGHASELRRAIKEGQGGRPNESFVPYGWMGPVKDPSLMDTPSLGDPTQYLENGFSFDELHSFTRNVNQMVSDAQRGTLTIDPDIVDTAFLATKQNALALNTFAEEALDAVRMTPQGTNVSSNGFLFHVDVKEVVVDGKTHQLQMLTVSKPMSANPGPGDWQQMTLMIPPGKGDYMARVEGQLKRLSRRTFEIWNTMLRQEARWARVRPPAQ